MGKKVISLPDPSKLPISPAVRAGDYIFVSGQIGFTDLTGKEVKGIEAQTKQCFENIKQILQAEGSSLSDIVKVTVFLSDSSNFVKMNEVYQSYLTKGYPARSTVLTSLISPDMLIEIECIAYSKK
jgi:2-iminobutanoate/2-iminopropanoate deaminase